MRITDPKVKLIAKTEIADGFEEYLEEENIDWRPDDVSSSEKLAELAGRVCYKSFSQNGKFENNNISRVREGNESYIKNVIESKHGSIFEHTSCSILINASRVVTHELIRHRAGTGFSQESGRYVRVDDIKIYIPDIIKENEEANEVFEETVLYLESQLKKLESIYKINDMKDFTTKKLLTSAFRRILPNGLMNDIVVTANHRAWRHMIELRSSVHAEVEIRFIFNLIAEIMKKEFPNIYQDMSRNDNGEWVFINSKI